MTRVQGPSGLVLKRANLGLTFAFVGMLLLSGYGTMVPASVRCNLPGAIGCAGGVLGAPSTTAASTYEQFFNVTMYDYGFWITNTVDGSNETSHWYLYEGWTVHINATSLKPDPSQGGTAYHGLGIEINATGQQLLNLAARVGVWATGTFTVPTKAYSAQRIWCTVECGPGHGGQHMNNVYIVAPTFVPSVAVSADHTSGTAPLTVAFNGTITGGTTPFNTTWTFGDGGTSYVVNPVHTYTQSGKYSALLSVMDSKGFTASKNLSIQINAAAALAASASASVTAGVAPLGTTLLASASGGAGGYSYSWSFGDGGSATGATVFHLYTAAGSYSALVTVRDSAGASTTAVASVAVRDPTGVLAVAVTASGGTGTAPDAVTLTATPSGGTAPYTVVWVFGDGTSGTGASVAHTYTVAGAFRPTAFATDSAGAVGMNGTSVSVSGGASAPLAIVLLESPSGGSPPLPVTASVSISGGSGTYPTIAWDFGDGGTASGAVASHTYGNVGHYNVSVTVTDSLGTIATGKTAVRVAGLGITIAVSPATGDAPLNVTGSATIQGGSGVYNPVQWTWGDGTTGTGSPLNHSFASNVTGTLTVHASVKDSTGATASATATLTILPGPSAHVTAVIPATTIFPIPVNLTLATSGGTGSFSLSPLWDFGDGATTRGPSPQLHLYTKPGSFHVTVTTNDSSGAVAIATTYVNLSSGLPASSGSGGGGPPEWVFNGVANPDQAALALMGFVAGTGLAMLLYKRFVKGRKPPAARPTPSIAASSGRGIPRIPSTDDSLEARGRLLP